MHRPAGLESSNQGLPRKEIEIMHKPAPTDYPVHELIRERWSPRAFASKSVPQNVLRSLFEAARWAPSSYNEQPWAYLVATRDEQDSFERMLSVLVEFNANWAKSAPVMAIAVAELAFAKNNAPNRNAQYDLGAATALLSVEATAEGLAVHQMAGWVFVEQVGLPLPSMPLLLAAGALAGTGHLSFFASLFYVILAAVAADSIWYQLGRRKGIKILQLLCKISLEPDSCVRRTEGVF